VASNRTQAFDPRKLRLVDGSDDLKLLQSGIFEPNTPVYVEYFVHQSKEGSMECEHMMRQVILHKLKVLGMTIDDIDIIMDIDEIVSYEFLSAAQICEMLEGYWDTSIASRSPLIRLSFPMFERSLKCLQKGERVMFRRFVSTFMVIGSCIEGIGDSNRHSSTPLVGVNTNGRPQVGRKKGYGEKFDYSQISTGNDTFHPSYNAADFRRMHSKVSICGGFPLTQLLPFD